MSRVAIVRVSDDASAARTTARDPEAYLAELHRAALQAGHQLVTSDDCEARVWLLCCGGDPVSSDHRPTIAVIDPGPTRPPFGYVEHDRSVLQSRVDAFVYHPGGLADAITWVTTEDRAARTLGRPRLTVIGTSQHDYGMDRAIPEEPLIIGRAMSFGQHPLRPDRVPTPTGSIARWHARVRNVAGAIEVADMESTNGTLVIRHGEPTRWLLPMERRTGRSYGPPSTAWLFRDPESEWTPLQIGDELQLPGFWRFRIDGDAAWRPDEDS